MSAATEPVGRKLVDICLGGFVPDRRLAIHDVPHDRLNGFAFLGFIRMKGGETEDFS